MLSTAPITPSITGATQPEDAAYLRALARIAIEAVAPSVDDGLFPVKRSVGDEVEVEADVIMDGHDKLAVRLQWREADQHSWQSAAMEDAGNSRWRGTFALKRVGRHFYRVQAWYDKFATYRDELEKKIAAGLDVSLELREGWLLVEKTLAGLGGSSQPATKNRATKNPKTKSATAESAASADIASNKGLSELLAQLDQAEASPADDAFIQLDESAFKTGVYKGLLQYSAANRRRSVLLLDANTLALMRAADPKPFAAYSKEYPLLAERQAAGFSSWYELFPRSQSGDAGRHGTFDDVINRLPAIAAMGFDTLYFPPIHPIGRKNRKGRNNALEAAADDPGSPYAIGASEGGHDAIHPELGSWEDFRRLRDAAQQQGLEIALDFAIQCSPDHPWLSEHPDWFDWRPDGSIRYAENPPKKYQDIVNVDFYNDHAIPELWIALRDVVMLWVKEGVRTFRVDNPHTKPFPFWEWLIRHVQDTYPDTIFLSEAFTYPKVMNRLSKVGFTQSYTYFTWRNTKAELIEYMSTLTDSPVRDFFRPHLFVNTPDINPFYLQNSGRQGFIIRATLAATLSGLWGISSGFELCESEAVRGKEEFVNSEKYEIRAWDWERTGNIIEEISLLNRLRKAHPALQSHLGLRFHQSSSEHILLYSKNAPRPQSQTWQPLAAGEELILVAVNLDPYSTHDTTLEIPLYMFGQPDDGSIEVEDLVGGYRFRWYGKWQQFTLNPFESPFAIWRLSHAPAA